ncbi:uncharacterized protein LOC128252262 [Drosophila gunungcola]|uniref:uncharacterized protein LOC128252262 n=1 Tax=Drosophila gunungcola TaxID=103775 RepID=UPI0022E1DF8B|nr:uncharacterized protein LOC128252262 [Drosophila gunungcola]
MELNIFDDCWELMHRFQRLVNDGENCEFEVFCRCWREMQLQHLFSGQSNHTEVIATTLAALHVAKRLSCSRRTNGDHFAASRSQRIAGFYLLYVIYNKQPTLNFVKIEVSPRTWQDLTNYVLQLRNDSPERKDTQQVAYMFWRLVQEQAFRFTALDYCQGLDNLVDYDRLETVTGAKRQRQSALMLKQQRPNNVSLTYDLEGLQSLDLASRPLCDLESAYNAQKLQLAGQQQALPPTQIFGQLREVFADIQKILGNNKNPGDEEQPTTSASNQLEVRQKVRNKAMYGMEERGPQHQPEELEVELEVNESYQRRMSSATVFQQPLSDDVQREYQIYDDSDDDEDEEEDSEVTEEDVQELLGS